MTEPADRWRADDSAAERDAGSEPVLTIGLDVGGTKVAAGLVDEAGQIRHQVRRDTPPRQHEPRVVEDVMVQAIGDLLDWARTRDTEVIGVGVGAAGFVSADRRRVVFAPHVSWRDEPVRDRLAARIDRPVVLDNDANAAAWAEYRFGAGTGESHLVMVTLGTGIGGAILREGTIERGRHGMAAEFGHMQVVPGGRECECGHRGCWEQYSSGRALRREAQASGSRPEQVDGSDVFAAAAQGDPQAVGMLTEIGTWLGVGLANLAAALDPGRFVVGGGVSAAGELLLAPARAALAAHLTGRGHRPVPPVLPAALGPEAGLIGAADLARVELGAGVKTTAETTPEPSRSPDHSGG